MDARWTEISHGLEGLLSLRSTGEPALPPSFANRCRRLSSAVRGLHPEERIARVGSEFTCVKQAWRGVMKDGVAVQAQCVEALTDLPQARTRALAKPIVDPPGYVSGLRH